MASIPSLSKRGTMAKRKGGSSEELSTASNRRSSRRKTSNEEELVLPKETTTSNRPRNNKKPPKPSKRNDAERETLTGEDANTAQVAQVFCIIFMFRCLDPCPNTSPLSSLNYHVTSTDYSQTPYLCRFNC